MSDSGQVLRGAKPQIAKAEWSAMLTRCVPDDSSSGQEPLRYFLPSTEKTVIGRAPECQVVLDPNQYTTVSRYHAEIRLLSGESQPAWEISNLSTTNATYVNDQQLEGWQTLQPGDRITLSWGGPEFIFEHQALDATVFVQAETSGSQDKGVSTPVPVEAQSEPESSSSATSATPPTTPPTPIEAGEAEGSLPSEAPAAPTSTSSDAEPQELKPSLSAPAPAEPESQAEKSLPVTPDATDPAATSEVEQQFKPAIDQPVAPSSPAVTFNQTTSPPTTTGRSLWSLSTEETIRTLSGHSDAIRAVAFSPDNQTLASGSADKTIKLWNLSTGQEMSTLSGHSSAVNALAVSPDNQTLASGSADKTIKLWNLSTGEEITSLSGYRLAVNAVAFSPDSQTLAGGSADKTIKLWNLSTGQEITTLSGHRMAVNLVAFSPDGQTLASGSEDKIIKLWNLNTSQEIYTLAGQSWQASPVTISPDGQLLASSSEDKTIKVWQP